MKASFLTPITLPTPTDDIATLRGMAACSWLHGVLRLFDVLSGRTIFRKLVDNDIQFLTISSRLALSAHEAQQANLLAAPDYRPGVVLLLGFCNLCESDHGSKALRADYANARLAAMAALRRI